jgi:hypothetical protein
VHARTDAEIDAAFATITKQGAVVLLVTEDPFLGSRNKQLVELAARHKLPAIRDLVWINVTTNPTAEWIARQITEAFPWNEAPRYLIRDRDRIYCTIVTRRLHAMGIRDKPIAPVLPNG